jgi:methanogenic corrinoid protein MtbC1
MDAASTLKRLGPAAAEHVLRCSLANGDDPYAAFGDRGRDFCRQDTLAHVDILDVALQFGSEEAFCQYVLWLGKVLEARGLRSGHLEASLRHLGEFLAGEVPESGRRDLQRIVEAGIRALAGGRAAPAYAHEPADAGPESRELAEALVRGDAAKANALLLEWSQADWLPAVVQRIVRPAMCRIGWWWQQGRISVAEEHLATEIAHRAVDHAFTRAERKPRRQKSVLLGCVEGNRHALGLRTVADAFDLEGWTAYNLGADVPLATLPAMVAAFEPDLVGLSVSMTQQLPAARAAIKAIRDMQPRSRARIMLGGLASNSLGEVWQWVGADLAASDALRAIEAASR